MMHGQREDDDMDDDDENKMPADVGKLNNQIASFFKPTNLCSFIFIVTEEVELKKFQEAKNATFCRCGTMGNGY